MAAPPTLDFALRFVDGRGVLGLGARTLFELVGVERLELTVPNLRFPFDVSDGPTRFQTRRCDFAGAELRIDGARLQTWIDGHARLGRLGISHLSARLADGRIELSARARVGDRLAAVTARVTLAPADRQRLVLSIDDVRVYGLLPAPAPLIGLGIALGLGAEAENGTAHPLTLHGVSEVYLNPLELLLWRALPPAGWRLPRYEDATLAEARLVEGAIVLRYGTEARAEAVPVPIDDERAAMRIGDARLAEGDLQAALDSYTAAAPASLAASERQLALLASVPARWGEAELLGARLHAEHPTRPQPLLALAAIEAERGLIATAAARYARLAELAEAAGERDDARAAALRAGQLLAARSPKEAIPYLERTLAGARDDADAATLLADAYAADGRWQDFLRLERWRLSQATDPAVESLARARIARVWLDELNDAVRARDELERALRLRPDDGALWALMARALEATGDPRRALEATARAATLHAGEARLALELRAAALAEAAALPEEALAHARAALAAVPESAPALASVAALLARLGRLDEAVNAYQDAIERAEEVHDDGARADLLVALAQLARHALHDRHGARAYVDRALAIAPSATALQLAAELADEDGRLDDLELLLGQLAAGGDVDARLRQAETLLTLGRLPDAAAAAEAGVATRPAAWAVLARIYEAAGEPGKQRHALEQSTAAAGAHGLAARRKLAQLRADDDDLEGARALLEAAVIPDAAEGRAELDSAAEGRAGVASAAEGRAGIDNSPDGDEARLAVELLVDVLLRQGDDAALDVALGRLAELRADAGGRARALSAQGTARARLGRPDDALASYRAALALVADDDDVEVRAGLGEAAYALKRWDEARAALEPLFARGLPPQIERALRLGEIAERQGHSDEALGFYEAALAAGAHAADALRAYHALAGLQRSRGDFAAEARLQVRAAEDERTNEAEAVRASRLVAAAELLRKRANRRDEAIALYERALALDPLQLAALDALEAIAAEDRDAERVAQVLGRKVAATARRPAEQRAILGRLAALQDELGRPDAARAAWTRVLELDPAYRPALTWLAADARTRGAGDEEAAALEKLTALAADPSDPDTLATALARLAQLWLARGRGVEAEAVARRALALHAREPRALAVLDERLVAAGSANDGANAELTALLAVRAEVETDFDTIVELLFRRAALLESSGQGGAAIQAYEQLISLRPSSATAWQRLAALLRTAGEWAPLAQLLTRLAERHALDGRRNEAEALYVEVDHLAHDRLGDSERARAVLHKALESEPRSKLALTSLLALARGRNDAAEEDVLLGRLAELADDEGTRAQAVGERARARHLRGDLDGALQLIGELPPAVTPDSALRLRLEIEEARGQPLDLPALETLRARAYAARDTAAERWALRRLVRAAFAQRSGAAEELARRALELDGDDREAAEVLAELQSARGHDPAHLAALERLLRIARRTFEGPAREAELLRAIAQIMARGNDADGALMRLREALEIAPSDGATLRDYGALLYSRGGAHIAATDALARAGELGALDAAGWALLGHAYDRLGDDERASAAFSRAGDAAPPRKRAEVAFRANNVADARAAALEVLTETPRDEEALGWAIHGLESTAVLDLLDGLAERLMAHDAAYLYQSLAPRLGGDEERLALERAAMLAPAPELLVALGDRTRGSAAAAYYEQALAMDAGCVPAALGLAAQGEPYLAARALQTAWAQASWPRQKAQLSAARGALLRDRLSDSAGARVDLERALVESENLAELLPLRAELRRSLAALARSTGDATAAEAALVQMVDENVARDSDLRHLGELLGERGAWEDVVELLSPLPGSSEVLERALETTGRLDELATRLVAQAGQKPAGEARPLLVRAAQLWSERLGEPARAAQLLERALPLGPADGEIWSRLGRLYLGPLDDDERGARCLARAYAADRGRSEVLLPLADFHYDANELTPAADYYREALARGAVPPEDAARVQLCLAEEARARRDGAGEEEALTQAAALGAPEAWALLGALYRSRGDGPKLAQALLRQADGATGRMRAALLREAALHLPSDEATELDEQILLLDRDDDEARDRILMRLRAGGDTTALIDRLERELPHAAPGPQAVWARELGRLAERLGDDARAESAWTTALVAAPSLEAAHALVALYRRQQRLAAAAPILEEALADPRLAVEERTELSRLCGEAYMAPGANTARALAFVENAEGVGLPVPVDGAQLRTLLRAERRFFEVVAALDGAALAAFDGDEQVRLELEAAETLERDLGHSGDAARRYAALFDRHPTRRDLATRARLAYAAANEPIYALAIVDRELKLVDPHSADGAQLKIAKGELLLQAGADAEAEAEFLHALITTPRVGRAHAALADVYKKRGDLAGALEHLIAAADAPDLEPMRAAACAVDAADVLLVEGDSATAERLYQLAAALDPADRRPVDALARLAGARGEHEKHADLLGRAAALTADRRERARLALQRARLFQHDLGRDLDAYRAYKEAVACDPNLREAARSLREMAEARGEWALAAEQRYRELALTTDTGERARLHVELARLLEDKLLDPAAALRNFEQAVELVLELEADGAARSSRRGVPVEKPPYADLVRLYAEAQRWRDAALAAERWAASLSAPAQVAARAEALARSGELHERAGDHERARARLAEAAALGGEAGKKADDNLMRLAEDGDPEELRRRLEERLAIEPEGPTRVEILRRALALAVERGDSGAVDTRSRELLTRNADDAEAFVARKRLFESRSDAASMAQLLRARADAVSDPGERAELYFEAGRLAEGELYDVTSAAEDYEAALALVPEQLAALDALADLSYRTRHVGRARALYALLGERASALGPDEVWRRRAELAEEAGDLDEARALYTHAIGANESNLSAHQSLARLALSRGDDGAAYQALHSVLELLPLDAVERITELRRHLGELALRLGDRASARHWFELVLSQLPADEPALEALASLYLEEQAWQEAADTLGRLSRLVHEPIARAELLYRRGEILRLGLGNEDAANDAYLKAADLHAAHAPTLRRLIAYYFAEGDLTALGDVARELEELDQPLEEAAVESGLGLALGGDEARGTILVALAKPTASRLAELLGLAKLSSLTQLDPALRAAARALGPAGRADLQAALELRLSDVPARAAGGTRLALARLHDAAGDTARARVHYAVAAFVEPTGLGAARLRELGPPEPFALGEDDAAHPSARGPLRDALVALAPLILGLQAATVDGDPAPAWVDKLRAVVQLASGVADFECAVVVDASEVAWAEPTWPPRLLLARRALADESVARFGAARAMHGLVAGVPLVEGRSPDDVAGLLRAAAALFLPDLRAPDPSGRGNAFVLAWQAELAALALDPEQLPEPQRSRLEMVLATAVVDSNLPAAATDYARAERLSADRVAYAATGDLRAALTALTPPAAAAPEARAALLTTSALAELIAFALARTGS
jgi:tetratricopeptide (TPR) repeat protein